MQRLRLTFAHLLLLGSLTLTACDEPVAPVAAPVTPSPVNEPSPAFIAPVVEVDMALPPLALVDTLPTDGSSAVELVSPVRIAFSRDMDPTATLAAISFSPAVECSARVDEALYTCEHAALLPSTTYVVTVLGSARDTTGASLGAERSFSFTTAPATAGQVSIAGISGRQVRQGAGEVTLTVKGDGLGSISSASLGTLVATVVSTSDTEAVLKVSIPHGHALGGLTLSLSSPQGSLEVANAVVVTAIRAAAGLGDDAAAGTLEAPFKTLTRALGVASAGDTIQLADGTYSQGESWARSSPNVPAGLKIEGTSVAGTVLTPAPGSPADVKGLFFSGNAEVTKLQIHGFYRGAVLASAGSADFGSVRIWGNTGDGLYLSSQARSLTTELEIDGNGGAGVRLEGSAYFSAIYDKLHDNRAGVHAAGSAQVALLGTLVEHNGSTAEKTHSGIVVLDAASAQLSGVISGNAAAGVYAETSGTLDVGGTVANNGGATGCANNFVCSGVVILSAATVKVGGEVASNKMFGVVSNGGHTVITMEGAKLHDNGFTNAAFDDVDTHSGYTEVYLSNTQVSGGANGIAWGDRVLLTMRGGSITNHAYSDLRNGVSSAGWSNRFINVKVGPAQQVYPATGTAVLSTPSGAVAGGPSWWILNPSASGGPGSITFTRQ